MAIRQGKCGAAWREGHDQRDLPKGFYVTVRRAVGTLERGGVVTVQRRKLATLLELVEHYPSKTLSLERRGLRRELLPHVAAHLENSGGRFTFAENEQFLARSVAPSAIDDWSQMESDVLAAALGAVGEHRSILVRILAKGRQYFGDASVNASDSLGQLISAGLKSASDPGERRIFEALAKFYGGAFPAEHRSRMRLKNKLYDVVRMGRGRRPAELTEELKNHLLTVAPSLLESLPGHATRQADGDWLAVNGHTFSPLLDQLIGRDVFRDFEFVGAA